MKPSATLFALAALVAATTTQAQSAKSTAWELKGLRLDMAAAEVKAMFPASECKLLARGVELCVDKTATFAAGPAHLVTKFLDGRLINVTLNRISRTQAASAAQGLIAKFGPTSYSNTKWKYVEADDKMQNVTTHVWNDGDIVLFVEPLDEFIRKTGTQYSAVTLTSRSKHDGAWIDRANNPDADVATDL